MVADRVAAGPIAQHFHELVNREVFFRIDNRHTHTPNFIARQFTIQVEDKGLHFFAITQTAGFHRQGRYLDPRFSNQDRPCDALLEYLANPEASNPAQDQQPDQRGAS